MAMRRDLLAMSWVVAIGCGSSASSSSSTPPPVPTQPARCAQRQFDSEAEAFYWRYMELNPGTGMKLGYHQYDGRLPDYSPEGLQAAISTYQQALGKLEEIDAAALTPTSRVEREVLLATIRGKLFDLVALEQPRRSPLFYLFAFNLAGYIERDYAPLADRARGVISVCDAAAGYFDQARANLPAQLPRTWLDLAMLQSGGMAEFADNDVRTALAGLSEPLATELNESLGRCVTVLTQFRDFLEQHRPMATDNFAIGEQLFLRMLRDKEGIDVTLERLRQVGELDYQRNSAALVSAAAGIDPGLSPGEVFHSVLAEKPPLEELLSEATRMSKEARRFVVQRDLVTIPSEQVAEVRESPPFMRWNSAFMSSPGPFENKSLPAFYYISPPDPSWPKQQQQDYVPGYGDLAFTSIHEVWPGHFLHGLHKKANPSKILASFCTYSMSEGWAHYTEEMMLQQGVFGADFKTHLGQLSDALLRNARFKAAIELHTGGATVEQAIAWFRELGMTDLATARQQAVRGTFDPGYLNYTLGKLMILKLREDWRAKQGADYTLKKFHDTFLSYGCAPIPVIRREMLGAGAGPDL